MGDFYKFNKGNKRKEVAGILNLEFTECNANFVLMTFLYE